MRPRQCIFCGSHRDLSREHFWPEWMHSHIPEQTSPAHIEQLRIHSQKTVLVAVPRNVQRQGGTRTKTMRIVCRACNSGWMSRVEQAAKPVLVPVISGAAATLSEPDRRAIATWIVLKFALADGNVASDAVLTQEDRKAFMIEGRVPSYLTIWVGRTAGAAWSTHFHRHAATMGYDPPAAGKSLQCVTVGAGQLLVQAILDRGQIGFGVGPGYEDKMPRLWPLQDGDLLWPPARTVTDVEAFLMASALENVIASPRVKWLPHPNLT